jgi:hypothetical protein
MVAQGEDGRRKEKKATKSKPSLEERAQELFLNGLYGYRKTKLEKPNAIGLLHALANLVVSSSPEIRETILKKHNMTQQALEEMVAESAEDLQKMLKKRKLARLEDLPAADLAALLMKYKGRLKKAQQLAQLLAQPPQAKKGPLFKPSYYLKICTWNSLKLRLEKKELEPYLPELVSTLAEFDVIALQEIRASKDLWERVETLRERLQAKSGVQWEMVVSESNGARAPEVHVILARAPIKIKIHLTMKTAGVVALDNAPLLVLLDVRKLVSNVEFIAVASVHMPPEGRHLARDKQVHVYLVPLYHSATG